MNILMLSCRRATELVEKKSVVGLNKKEKVQLFLHTSMCEYCSKYEKQSTQLDTFFNAQVNNENIASENKPTPDLSSLKQKINSQINK